MTNALTVMRHAFLAIALAATPAISQEPTPEPTEPGAEVSAALDRLAIELDAVAKTYADELSRLGWALEAIDVAAAPALDAVVRAPLVRVAAAGDSCRRKGRPILGVMSIGTNRMAEFCDSDIDHHVQMDIYRLLTGVLRFLAAQNVLCTAPFVPNQVENAASTCP